MRTNSKLTPENVNKWNATFHKILTNYVPLLVFLLTGNYANAFTVLLLLAPVNSVIVKTVLEAIKSKFGT